MSEYADPDLETIAPLPPSPPPPPQPPWTPPPRGRGPTAAFVAAVVVVSLVVGFGTATVVLNTRDDNSQPTATAPSPTSPTSPATLAPGATGPATTSPNRVPTDPDESALGALILRQADVPTADAVELLPNGADLTIATLDLCNGIFPSEAQRTARRQVVLTDAQSAVRMSTEAVLYRGASGGAQAFAELRSVAARCPSTPVTSPVGEGTATTRFRAAPDGSWPRAASVERLAYDFDTTDAATGKTSHSMAVYLRRGRALMGVYFAQPDGAQISVAGKTSVADIVAVFEARMAQLPASVVNG